MYPDAFTIYLTDRGATGVERLRTEKRTTFLYEGVRYSCTDPQRRLMASELADGYELMYCVSRYCERVEHTD